MSKKPFDFYAPIDLPDNRGKIYGVAAANYRVAQAGGFNKLAASMVEVGMRMGFQQAVRVHQKGGY